MASNNGLDPKHRSRALTEGPARAAARAYLKGIGYDDEALSKPLVAVANTWTETMPCNFPLRALAAKVKDGIKAAGGTPMELNTIAISDGITMGTAGRRACAGRRPAIGELYELACGARSVSAQRPQRDAVRRLDPARPSPRRAAHDPGGVRGGRRPFRGQDHRR